MTPEAINVAIAEWRGWSVKHKSGDPFKYLCRPGEMLGVCYGLHLTKEEIFKEALKLGDCGPEYVIPNYYGSLDCIAEAEGALTDEQRERYAAQLEAIVENDIWERRGRPTGLNTQLCLNTGDPHGTADYNVLFTFIHASAPQRCEALCRTLGLGEYRTK